MNRVILSTPLLRVLRPLSRFYSIKTPTNGWGKVQKIAESKDRKMFAAWHPTEEFPYEFTKPIPDITLSETSTVLKNSSVENARQTFKSKHPEFARQELMKITYTTKHPWYPRARDKKAKKTEMDRPYL